MDNKKFEQLINLVINEHTEQANELFHEIVVEKSREIFESIMDSDDEEDLEEGLGGQVGDLLDEINSEEEGMTEDEEEMDFTDGDDSIELTGDEEDFGYEGAEHEEIEDAVIRIEDKLDQLMAEFEEIMAGDDAGEEDFGNDESEEDFGDEDFSDDEEDFGDEDEEAMMEAVQLQKVSVTHGDNGVQNKSPVTFNSGKSGMDSKPVSFTAGDEKGRSAPTTKDLPGAGKFKNSPGQKGQDLTSAPKPKHGDDGSNNKSPVAESRRAKRRPIR